MSAALYPSIDRRLCTSERQSVFDPTDCPPVSDKLHFVEAQTGIYSECP
jgi:hypothetical protein